MAVVGGDALAVAVERLVRQVTHWQAQRWSDAGSGHAADSRGDRVYALVQRLADGAALAEGRAPGAVPRLADPVLPDQLRVVAADLATAAAAGGTAADVLTAAAADVDAVRRTL